MYRSTQYSYENNIINCIELYGYKGVNVEYTFCIEDSGKFYDINHHVFKKLVDVDINDDGYYVSLMHDYNNNYLADIMSQYDIKFFVPAHAPTCAVKMDTIEIYYYHSMCTYNNMYDPKYPDVRIINVPKNIIEKMALEEIYIEYYYMAPPFKSQFYSTK